MKKLALFFMICILALGATFAQQEAKKTPEERAEKQIARMTEDLSLTDEQVAKLKPAIVTRITKVREARQANNQEGIKNARKEYHEILKSTLTEEQFKKHKELKKEGKANRKNKKGKGKAEDED